MGTLEGKKREVSGNVLMLLISKNYLCSLCLFTLTQPVCSFFPERADCLHCVPMYIWRSKCQQLALGQIRAASVSSKCEDLSTCREGPGLGRMQVCDP